jgi:hypothetical protein
MFKGAGHIRNRELPIPWTRFSHDHDVLLLHCIHDSLWPTIAGNRAQGITCIILPVDLLNSFSHHWFQHIIKFFNVLITHEIWYLVSYCLSKHLTNCPI